MACTASELGSEPSDAPTQEPRFDVPQLWPRAPQDDETSSLRISDVHTQVSARSVQALSATPTTDQLAVQALRHTTTAQSQLTDDSPQASRRNASGYVSILGSLESKEPVHDPLPAHHSEQVPDTITLFLKSSFAFLRLSATLK